MPSKTSFQFRRFGLRTALAALVIGSGLRAATAAAQTTFAWPPAPDVATYQDDDQCLFAVHRVITHAQFKEFLDLVEQPFDSTRMMRPDTAVANVAQHCSAKWAAANAPLTFFQPLLELWLYSGRDADVRTWIARRFTMLPGKSDPLRDSARYALLDTILTTYENSYVRPVRFSDEEAYIDSLAHLPRTPQRMFDRVARVGHLLTDAIMLADTARAHRFATEVLALTSSLTPAEKTSPQWHSARALAFQAITLLSWSAQLDSLRHSTAAYVALVRSNWTKATGERVPSELPIGEQAKPIHGDFWFAPAASGLPRVADAADTAHGGDSASIAIAPAARPTAGHLSLVTFFVGGDIRSLESSITVLQRLHARYPSIEMTMATKTEGYFLDQVPQPADQEAERFRRWVLDFEKSPVDLAVENTPFFRLPGLDRRRIDEATDNVTNYAFGQPGTKLQTFTYLVDEHGTILLRTGLDSFSVIPLQQMLDILLHRSERTQ
jgi:hypothetical protein